MYKITKHWINGQPIDQYICNTLEELYEISIIKEQLQKENFLRLSIGVMYCMPYGLPHYSSYDLIAEFTDGADKRICNIDSIENLKLPMYEVKIGKSYITLPMELIKHE